MVDYGLAIEVQGVGIQRFSGEDLRHPVVGQAYDLSNRCLTAFRPFSKKPLQSGKVTRPSLV